MAVRKSDAYWLLTDQLAERTAIANSDSSTKNLIALAETHFRFATIAYTELNDTGRFREHIVAYAMQWLVCLSEARDNVHESAPFVSLSLVEVITSCLSAQEFALAQRIGESTSTELLRTGHETPFFTALFRAIYSVLNSDSAARATIEYLKEECDRDRFLLSHAVALEAILHQDARNLNSALQTIETGQRVAIRSGDFFATDDGDISFTITGIYNLAAEFGVVAPLGFSSSRVPEALLLGYDG